jgi:hypothetical protein
MKTKKILGIILLLIPATLLLGLMINAMGLLMTLNVIVLSLLLTSFIVVGTFLLIWWE